MLILKCIRKYSKERSSVIILESGYGDYSKAWNQTAEELTEYGTILTYDRAGLGKSGKSSKKRISSEMVKDLRTCLNLLQLKPPYIFVGHSFGGINARLFTDFYPEDMLGIVLVDSTPENYKEAFLPIMFQNFKKLTINNLYMKVLMKSLCLVWVKQINIVS